LANFSPGLERSDNPGLRNIQKHSNPERVKNSEALKPEETLSEFNNLF
jgi:hypothetical protein